MVLLKFIQEKKRLELFMSTVFRCFLVHIIWFCYFNQLRPSLPCGVRFCRQKEYHISGVVFWCWILTPTDKAFLHYDTRTVIRADDWLTDLVVWGGSGVRCGWEVCLKSGYISVFLLFTCRVWSAELNVWRRKEVELPTNNRGQYWVVVKLPSIADVWLGISRAVG